MKIKIFFVLLFLIVLVGINYNYTKESEKMNWNNLSKERIELGLPLLIVKGSKGFLACGYINAETCNKTNEACAIVSGVKTHDDMVNAEIKIVSKKAEELGIKVGMKGQAALELFR